MNGARWYAFAVPILSTLLSTAEVSAQTDDDLIEQIRNAAIDAYDPGRFGANYAAIVNFAVSPDISTATFRVDEDELADDPTLRVSRLPLRYIFNRDSDGVKPFVEGLLAYQTLDAEFPLIEPDNVDSRWRTIGVTLAGGAEVPLGEHATLLPVVTVGYGSLENEARYRGDLAEQVFRPVFENFLFNWETDVVTYGAALGIDYLRDRSTFSVEARASVAYNRVEAVDPSSEFVDFNSDMTTLDAELNTVHPIPISLGNSPLSLVTIVGTTQFVGHDRDALGFDAFYEAGLALQADLSHRGWRLKGLRIGGKAIFGDGVSGWSLVLSPRF